MSTTDARNEWKRLLQLQPAEYEDVFGDPSFSRRVLRLGRASGGDGVKAAAQRRIFEVTRLDWETPPELFAELDAEFGFTLDPCASHENAKCERYYTPENDGLRQDWSHDVVFMNPPYGREIGRWVRKASEEAQRGAIVVGLIPSRTDTAWWHDYCAAAEVRFLRGRVRFSGGGPAPFPSAVVVWGAK